jgi:hypothetical protein
MQRAEMPFSISRSSLIMATVIILGCAIRLAACVNTCMINPDGVVYIHQAGAVYHGRLESAWAPGMSYLSIQPFLTVAAYFFSGDWIRSAVAVSWLFGSALLFPVFLLMRRFFDDMVAALGVLLFAVMPVFVDISCMIVKEPVAVFFAASGLHFFLKHMEEGDRKALLWSGICFVLASWARIECLMFFGVSFIFVLSTCKRRPGAAVVFLIPVAGIFAGVAVSNTLTGIGAGELLRLNKIVSFFSEIFMRYDSLRFSLKELAVLQGRTNVGFFLADAPNLLWFTAIGAVIKCFAKTLFYPMVLLFALGLPRAFRRFVNDRRIVYLAAIAVGSLVVLYAHELTQWYIFPRYMTLSILPLMFVPGCGIATVCDFFKRCLRTPEPVVAVLLAVCFVVITLPKNLRERECDKVVFKHIGEVAASENVHGPVMISASAPVQRWVSFYANRGNPGRFDRPILDHHWDRFPKTKELFLRELRKRDITYIVWDEVNWGKDRFPIYELLDSLDVRTLGEWCHPDTGRMLLFRLHETNPQPPAAGDSASCPGREDDT